MERKMIMPDPEAEKYDFADKWDLKEDSGDWISLGKIQLSRQWADGPMVVVQGLRRKEMPHIHCGELEDLIKEYIKQRDKI